MNEITGSLRKSAAKRTIARFEPTFLTPKQEFTNEEHARLRTLIPNPVGLGIRERFAFLVNLSYASSRLEGNTYTEIDTRTLLEDNIPSAENTAEETRMILSHKGALDQLLKADKLDKPLILEIHRGLESISQASDNTQHLDKPKHSSCFEAVVSSANSILDPIEQAVYLFTRLPYLQASYNLTSRIIGNFPLLKAGDYPISFMGFPKGVYYKGIMDCYELCSTEFFKAGFVEAYLHSALRFHPFDLTTSIYLRSQSKAALLCDLRKYILENEGCDAVEKMVS